MRRIFKALEIFSLIIIMLFAFVGVWVTGTAAHELQHKADFAVLKPYNDSICALILPDFTNLKTLLNYNITGIYYYHFNDTTENVIAQKKIEIYTEDRAKNWDTYFWIFFAVILSYFFVYRIIHSPVKRKRNI